MKTFGLCSIVGGLAYILLGYQMGIFDQRARQTTDAQEEKKEAPRARFPEDLARAVRQQGVAQAAAFHAEAGTHRLVFLKESGVLHPWQERVPEEWQAEAVEDTELVVVVLPQSKTMLSRHTFPNGAPPVERFQWETGAYVVEAKTGLVQASRSFRNVPRSLKSVEAWELTAIGEPVAFRTVFGWVASMARAGFPPEPSDQPLITVVE